MTLATLILATCIVWPSERILLVGDSLAVGLRPHLARALQARGTGAFRSIAEGGTNIYQWSTSAEPQGRRLAKALATFHPTLVIISLGTNDEAARTPGLLRPYGPAFDVARQRTPHAEALRDRLRDVCSVWLGPPAALLWSTDRPFRHMLSALWGENFLDSELIDPERAPDHIHLTASGNEAWTSALLALLEGHHPVEVSK